MWPTRKGALKLKTIFLQNKEIYISGKIIFNKTWGKFISWCHWRDLNNVTSYDVVMLSGAVTSLANTTWRHNVKLECHMTLSCQILTVYSVIALQTIIYHYAMTSHKDVMKQWRRDTTSWRHTMTSLNISNDIKENKTNQSEISVWINNYTF